MDKRWIGILLILIAGLVCMYYIVDNSTTVGNAISVINDVTIPVPQEMKISVSNRNDVTFLNENTNESIYINCVDKNPEKAFDKYITSFENSNNVKMTNRSNSTVQIIDYKNVDSGQNTSFVLFKKVDHAFIMKMNKYSDLEKQDKDMNYIIDNLVHDYKQNKGQFSN